ncbi:ribokinase [Clostridium weizhouense]|uniref:Ribokinase n=1 Tax=Clostridium weizhouense TaxID=2859781 RepID=A0ABS7AKM8_9CLOT|nr:ribokinase [Clostridium weizhouense]MBW6409224.1 ribokinase [Clostridium weizhouense]
MNNICILGSINMDFVFQIENMPKEGETILSNNFKKIPGGKGANQAVAARRSGANVYMIGKVGNDDNGRNMVEGFKKEGMNTQYISIDENETTGMAMIMVNKNGNNSIIVEPGANMKIDDKDIDNAEEAILNSDIVISQFETPEDIAIKAFKRAKELNKITILNPAPAKTISDELLKYTDMIIPNETEAQVITGVTVSDLETAKKAAKILIDKGVKYTIITLGEKGAAVVSKEDAEIVNAFKVNAIDTTAAGDSFIGGLSSKLCINELSFDNLTKAVKFGNMVSSLAVQKEGAQTSIPYLEEVIRTYKEEL